MKNYNFLFYVTLLFASSIFAQIEISGKVLDEAGFPLPGANIIEQGTKNGTTTNFEGDFKFSTKSDTGKITISFLGYEDKELLFSPSVKSFENVQMALSDNLLGEVVLIGYGTINKKNVTTAVSNVDNIKTINSRPVSNLKDFLQGNMTGVTVMQDGGDPSREGSVIIRGISGFNLDKPLTVVDGVPYYGPAINPNDIETVSVLKDASAQAIYGAQAGNGVIVIKTKKGKLGKPVVNINVNGGVQVASNLPTPLNAKQQADVYKTAYKNAGLSIPSAYFADKNPWGQTTRTNWMRAIFRPAEYQNYNASISGASENINYMASLGYNTKEGILQGTKSDRYSVRLKSDFDLSDKLTIGKNIYYSRTETIGANTSSGYSGAIINAMYMPSAAPVRDADGEFHGVVPFNLSQFASAYGEVYNPVALLLRPTTTSPVNNINVNVFGEYEILDGLKFKSTFGYSSVNEKYKRFSARIPELGRTNEDNSLTQIYSDKNIWTWENQLGYEKSFGSHNINLTAVYSAQHDNYEEIKTRGTGFAHEEVSAQFMGNASKHEPSESRAEESSLTSAIGRVMYNYDNRYFISGSLRKDKSSRLPVGNKSDYFPAASLGWIISNENFFKTKTINFLKVRASWGEIGNLSSLTPYRAPLMKSQNVNIGEDAEAKDPGKYLANRVNYDLKWERLESKNIGLDAEFFNNRLGLTFDYYEKTTKGMVLRGLPDPHWGNSNDYVNGGDVLNKGYEVSVFYKDNFGNVGFKVYGNVSFMSNVLLNFNGYGINQTERQHKEYRVRGVLDPIKSSVGEPLYSYKLIPFEGIFKNKEEVTAHSKDGELIQPNAKPGDAKFTDVNGDGKINSDDAVYMGSYQPKVTYNFGLNFDYKGFDFGAFFQGVGGVKIFNASKFATHNASLQGFNLDNRVLNAWSVNNTSSSLPRISRTDKNSNFSTTSSMYLEDGDYLRLKNITIGYTFSNRHIPFMKSSTLRAYFSAENLFTITNYSGIDPEVSFEKRGVDMGEYPMAKTLSMGLSLKL